MSEDLIRRSDAIKALDANFTIKGKENMQTVLNYLELVRTRIESAPSIEPKRGEWVLERLDNYKLYKVACSCCGWWGCENYDSYVDISDFTYCPNCGADMREREGE